RQAAGVSPGPAGVAPGGGGAPRVPADDRPRQAAPAAVTPAAGPVLPQAEALRRGLGRGRATGAAVAGVSLTVREGQTLGVVGESGSGKTTLGRMLVRLLDPTAGHVTYRGHDITRLGERAMRPLRRELQMVFQDPVSSLNPRRS